MPIKKSITPQDAVDSLNDFFKRDPKALHCLVSNRVPADPKPDGLCADDCEAQVDSFLGGSVGMLGIINGLFGTDPDGWGCIAIEFSDDHKPTGFVILER